jgi:hypothetical protein
MYGGLWVARVRDAHAWCRAHVGGRWIDVDTTPGIWRERESGHDGWTDRARDFLSWLRYRLEVWRRSGDDWQTVPVALALAALAWLGWRQIRGTRLRRASRAGTPRAAPTVAGMDSEFYALARRIEREHGARESWETMPAWLRRVMPGTGSGRTSVLSALALHQRLRFDPRGLSGEERRRLEEIVGQSMVTRTR